MPRIVAVKVEAFNGPQDIAEGETIYITDNPGSDVAYAVEADHPCEDLTACDIAAALHNGFPLVAAGLLSGATECAHIDAVCFAHHFNKTLKHDPRTDIYSLDEWNGWEVYFADHARMCESCGAANFDTYPGDRCGNCLVKLLYRVDDEVEFYYGDMFPEEEGPRFDDLITALVLPADPNDRGLVNSGVIVDKLIDPDFWLRVKDIETNEEYEIRASYLQDPVIKIGEDA